MTNHGGRAEEPTSYGLQPPTPAQPSDRSEHPGGPAPVPPPGAGAGYPAGPGAGAAYGAAPVPGGPVPGGPVPGGPVPGPGAVPQPRGPVPASGGSPAGVAVAGSGADPRTGAQPDPGRVIGGRYRLVSRLGHGGMGTVWKAHDQVVDREVAVKEPRVPETLPERDRHTVHQRMRREARAAARIDHPSVVTVHDVVIEDDRPWIVMELVHGQSLADRLAEGTLDPREAARIGLAVLGALAAAHDKGVLHRDVKPDNVLLGRNDRVVLTDFGIAQVEGEQGLTETGAFVGSPEYIAPERVLGQRPGPESDLWSLGVVLYAAVEGMSPFRRSHTPATLQAILSAEPQTPARGTGALGTLIMQLLRKDPAARPSAAEARRMLESVVHPPQPPATLLAAAAPGPGGAGTGNRFVPPVLHRNRKAQGILGAGVLAVAAAVTLAVLNPFAGDEGLPDGWTLREDPEVVSASVAVPGDYRRSVDDGDPDDGDGTTVTYNDPSGVFTISVTRTDREDGNEAKSATDAANQLIEWYRSDENTDMDGARSTKAESFQEGYDAIEVATTYQYENADEDDLWHRVREHIVVDKKRQIVWELSVFMPDAGDARTIGDQLFEDARKHLEIAEEPR
ncbi:serine/threonine protein kinase [Streptomyces pactum]|uniref:non-specific serine/threonine protein kinase n=1 Tax=Streptomyces pactum TaxID=68249 RepID=A0ABS0NML1_9ACTN|nr:serine/threonine-protein kinase [Streptomyces pactum]MBH5336449.1 serine/threonine protein kinase [Streptomyces pactum]